MPNPLIRHARMLGVFLLLGFATAANLTAEVKQGSVVLTSDSMIRFTIDQEKGQVLIPEAVLDSQLTLPADLGWTMQGTTLVIPLKAGQSAWLSPTNKQLYIGTLKLVQDAPSAPEAPVVYYLANSQPQNTAALLMRLYPGLKVEVDDRQRALMVIPGQFDRKVLDQAVRQLDAARPQVLFEAEILEVNRTFTQALGIDYDNLFKFTFKEAAVPASPFSLGRIVRDAATPFAISTAINALKSNGAAKVLAQPRVTTLDGVEARIFSTQNTPVPLGTKDGVTGVQTLTTGITLRMLPKIAPDGSVEAQLNISVSVPNGGSVQGISPYSAREASTTVRVKNGEPIAIAGLLEYRKVDSVSKIPLLGDIPLIGWLFTNTRTDEFNTDLVIIVTPRIVNDAPIEVPSAAQP